MSTSMRRRALPVLLLLFGGRALAQDAGGQVDASAPAAQAEAPAAPDANAAADTAAPVATIPVNSKSTAAPAAAPASDDGSTRLEDVVVTATKRREASREVPISINAFRGEDLEKRGAKGLEEILQFAPGVSINKNTSADNNYVSIRGVSTNSNNNVYTRPTGLFLEDASLS
ncbi:MAG TPA: Plug domain-containing protein, partial [Nevskiaceae bacterium]|nr:Plug domain-containing protein [Nevskiaceae bacterium]